MATILPDDMYDAIYPLNIPQSAKYVAGYVDGAWPWMARSPSLFPNAVKVSISAIGAVIARVGDRETGDMSPTSLVSWVRACRAADINAIGYCNYSAWGEVQAAFNNAGVAQPPYWIALYDGIRSLPVLNGIQAVAKQYANPGPYDLSCISDTFLSIVGGTMTDPIDANIAAFVYQGGISTRVTTEAQLQAAGVDLTSLFGRVFDTQLALTTNLPKLDQILTKLTALTTLEGKTDADVLAAQTEMDSRLGAIVTAIAALPAPSAAVGPTDAQMAALATTLEGAYPSYTVNITKV